MYSSGQFARMYQVSKKTLRHYAEIGLLVPAGVNAQNGYALYDEAQRQRMDRILYLRRLHLPLEAIAALVDASPDAWLAPARAHLVRIRAEQRELSRIDNEITALCRRIDSGKGIIDHMERKTEFAFDVFELSAPVWVVGYATRVVGSPEQMPTIEALIGNFFGDDAPSKIPGRALPGRRFGICAECEPGTNVFTYMMGDQVDALEGTEPAVPAGMRSYRIPAGHYAKATFSAPDMDTITGPLLLVGYDKLFAWIAKSDWAVAEFGVTYEVYDDERFEVPSWPEMDIWAPVQKKG